MEMAKLINQKVMHKAFGEGIIIEADDSHLKVEFANAGKVSKFAYPSCFNNFLKMQDEDLQQELEAILIKWRLVTGEAQKEELKQKHEKTVQGIEARRQAAKEKKLQAAKRAKEYRMGGKNLRNKKAENV